MANFGLAFGTGSIQLTQAVDYYLQVKAAAPANAKITLTGHSLGGGLAALVGVFFGAEAHTFDQAPFAQSARWTENTYNVATALRQYLADKTGLTGPEETTRNELLGRLDGFIAQRDAAGANGDIPNSNLITNINVQGEVLDNSLLNYYRIGRTVQDLKHGETTLSGTDLHSIALLSAFKLNDGFRNVTFKLTDLLAMVFDKQLFAFDTDKSDPNLLEHLLRHQVGLRDPVTNAVTLAADKMLDRFTADLGTLAATPGFAASGNLTDALIAFAMQGYYSGPHAADAGKQMLDAVGGGIHLDRDDIAGSLGEIKGYSRYFQNFLATLPETERQLIGQKLSGLLDWYLAGTALNASAGNKTAFMLGAGLSDSLAGGTQADLLVGLGGIDRLVGNGGGDTLVGGAGADTLMGGAGNDTYVVTDGDTIIDAADDGFGGDGQGVIQWDGQNPAGSYDLKPDSVTEWGDADWTFEFVGERETGGLLTIVKGGERITVMGFKSGMFGIVLNAPEEEQLPPSTEAPDDDATTEFNSNEHYLYNQMNSGRMVITVAGTDAEGWGNGKLVGDGGDNHLRDGPLGGDDILIGNGGRDALEADVGNDFLDGGGGQDVLSGGDGNDFLTGGDDLDLLSGGSGRDALLGGEGDDVLFGGDTFHAYQHGWSVERNGDAYDWNYVHGLPSVEGDLADYLDGGTGNDVIEGGRGDDLLMGGTGSDKLTGDNGNDVLNGGADDDRLFGDRWRDNSPDFYHLPEYHGDDILIGGGGNDSLWGDGGSDFLYGGDDNDELIGDGIDLPEQYQGRDVLYGESGNDKLWGYGNDDFLDGGIGEDHLEGGEGNDTLMGGDGADGLMGDAGNDTLVGGKGADALDGGAGDDTYILAAGDGQQAADGSVDTIKDGSGDDTVVIGAGLEAIGHTPDNLLVIQYGNNDLVAVMNSGVSIERYVIGGESLSCAELIGRYSSEAISAVDQQGNQNIIGGYGNDSLSVDSAGGNTSVSGGRGNDAIYGYGIGITYHFGMGDGQDAISYNTATDKLNTLQLRDGISPGDIIVGRYGQDLVIFVSGMADTMLLKSFFDGDSFHAYSPVQQVKFADGTTWNFEAINSRLSTGIASPYHLVGTSEDDRFTIDNRMDTITEAADGGVDTVDSWITYSLGDNLENLNLMGTTDLDAWGNSLNNVIRGNSGNNELYSGTGGNDMLIGGAGNDVYYFEQGSTVEIIEHAGEGNDTVWVRGSYTLPDHFENLGATGSAYFIQLVGNSQNNVITGRTDAIATVDQYGHLLGNI